MATPFCGLVLPITAIADQTSHKKKKKALLCNAFFFS
jgi:hypothetical protein